ncbi:MAG: hypothetical protein ACXQS8_07120 [Candidatus Helarchaeales archaeon]
MSFDVSKDNRILIVERVLEELKELTVQKKYKLPASKEKTLEAIKRLNSAIKKIKYSYISPLDLVNDAIVKEFDLMANQFWEAILKNMTEIEKNKFISARLHFIFNILRGFKKRLELGNENTIENAIDVIAARIISVTTLDRKQGLKTCRVGDETRIFNVVTNLASVKKDMILPIAILPPRQFGTEVSEAMFCSEKDLSGDSNVEVGQRVKLPKEQLKEVNNQVIQLLKA